LLVFAPISVRQHAIPALKRHGEDYSRGLRSSFGVVELSQELHKISSSPCFNLAPRFAERQIQVVKPPLPLTPVHTGSHFSTGAPCAPLLLTGKPTRTVQLRPQPAGHNGRSGRTQPRAAFAAAGRWLLNVASQHQGSGKNRALEAASPPVASGPGGGGSWVILATDKRTPSSAGPPGAGPWQDPDR